MLSVWNFCKEVIEKFPCSSSVMFWNLLAYGLSMSEDTKDKFWKNSSAAVKLHAWARDGISIGMNVLQNRRNTGQLEFCWHNHWVLWINKLALRFFHNWSGLIIETACVFLLLLQEDFVNALLLSKTYQEFCCFAS